MENCPFTNNPCPNPKDMQVSKTENGIKITCEACQVCGPSYLLIHQLKSHFKDKFEIFTLQDASKFKKFICKSCGTSIADIAGKAFFGCPDCYTAHKAFALQIFDRCQKSCRHKGKIPKHWEEQYLSKNLKAQIQMLEAKITNAVKVENYEIAAILKKKIDELKKGGTKDA